MYFTARSIAPGRVLWDVFKVPAEPLAQPAAQNQGNGKGEDREGQEEGEGVGEERIQDRRPGGTLQQPDV